MIGGAQVKSQIGFQGFPLCDQFVLTVGIGAGQEARQLLGVLGGFVQASREQQGPGIEQQQSRSAHQQVFGHFFTPSDDLRQAAALQYGVAREPLQQVSGDVRLVCPQRVFECHAYIILGDVPLTRAAKHRLDLYRRQLAGQHG
ncbi:hypothetical protein D3C76_1102690 [compost metagenome]